MQSTASESVRKGFVAPPRDRPAAGAAPSTLRPALLGWLSIALGVAAIAKPAAVARLMGVPPTSTARAIVRGVGARELGVGVGLLAKKRASVRLTWLRVLGDAMDLSLLAGAVAARRAKRQRVLGAVGAIAGIAALDLAAAVMQSNEARARLL